MPTGQPSNADTGDTPQARQGDAREADTAGAVLSDDALDDAPGGGGLMGAGAGGPEAGTARGQAGAATPNSPIDAALPHDGGDAIAEAEARVRSGGEDVPTEQTAP